MQQKCTTSCAQLDLISLALRGKKVSFAKVITMIDDMVVLLGKEQVDDDEKKEYCLTTFDSLDDQKKAHERMVSDLNTAIAETEDAIATLTEELKNLAAGIKALDKSVAEATAQRKEEHAEYNDNVASDTAAKELLKFAKNRLNQFYNPKLYVAPAKRELDREGRIYTELGGDIPTAAPGGIANTGIKAAAFAQREAPPPPPDTWGAYKKKSEDSTGVIEMIDLLIADLDKDLTEGETEEKSSQAGYEEMMKDSAMKRASDSKLIAEKEEMKAGAEADLLAAKENLGATSKKLQATLQVIHATHQECDWLLQNFDARKTARAGEVDSLKNAKAILSGADYSLLQTNPAQTFLRKQN